MNGRGFFHAALLDKQLPGNYCEAFWDRGGMHHSAGQLTAWANSASDMQNRKITVLSARREDRPCKAQNKQGGEGNARKGEKQIRVDRWKQHTQTKRDVSKEKWTHIQPLQWAPSKPQSLDDWKQVGQGSLRPGQNMFWAVLLRVNHEPGGVKAVHINKMIKCVPIWKGWVHFLILCSVFSFGWESFNKKEKKV